MCGICGIIDLSDKPVNRGHVERMRDRMTHRGPDDCGIHMMAHAGLGHRRLSIIDLDGSRQPMSNEDGGLWLVFNGEIYNYQALRATLEGRGHAFKTAGDTETILHLYEDHGLDFVDYLNGMFAIAIWDSGKQRLVLARDRLGIKPLYYGLHGRQLVFASETKAILTVEGLPRTMDHAGIAGYLNYSSVPGELTCFQEIKRLLPGHLAVFDDAGLRVRRYWDINYSDKRDWHPRELEESVEETLQDAVGLRMLADVPVGAFLSGGIDSSLVTAFMAKESSRPVETFSIGYGREGAFMNELPYAKAVADRHGMNHHELILDPDHLLRELTRVVWHLDEPCGDPAAFLTLALSEFTRRHVTVSLSGLGGDEFFAGYRRYVAIKWQQFYLGIPMPMRRGLIEPLIRMLPASYTSRFANLGRQAKKFIDLADADVKASWRKTVSYLPAYDGPILTDEMRSVARDTYTSDAFEHYWSRVANLPAPVEQAMYMDAKMYMVDQLLMLQDKMSMAVSLEARVPLLDHRLVELAASIPIDKKLPGRNMKAILKRIAERHIPRHCIYRPKKGFAAPLANWFRGPLRDPIHEALSTQRVRDRGIFDVSFVEWVKREFYEHGREISVMLYQLFLLETWLQLFIDGGHRQLDAPTAATHL